MPEGPEAQARPWPQRMQMTSGAVDLELHASAKKAHPRVAWWWNQRTVGNVHGAWCYLCEAHVATWARRWPMTMQAIKEVMEHRREHGAELAKQKRQG